VSRRTWDAVKVILGMAAAFSIGFSVVAFIVMITYEEKYGDIDPLDTCEEAGTTLTQHDPAYHPKLDHDRDGIACE
jgi:Excalibur calcium-binding domain